MKLGHNYVNYSLSLVWNESISGNQHNLGKFGRGTVHSHGGQWSRGDCNVYQGLRSSSAILSWMFTSSFDMIDQLLVWKLSKGLYVVNVAVHKQLDRVFSFTSAYVHVALVWALIWFVLFTFALWKTCFRISWSRAELDIAHISYLYHLS